MYDKSCKNLRVLMQLFGTILLPIYADGIISRTLQMSTIEHNVYWVALGIASTCVRMLVS